MTASVAISWTDKDSESEPERDRTGELTGFSPGIDRIFPSSTSKRYSKG